MNQVHPDRRPYRHYAAVTVLASLVGLALGFSRPGPVAFAQAPAPPAAQAQGFVGMGFEGDQGSDPPIVGEVTENGPAARAGIQEGDRILKIGAVDVKDVKSAIQTFRALKPGDKVTVKVKRKDREMDVEFTIGKRPPPPSWDPEVAVQAEDYAQVRKQLRTKLLREGPAPQKEAMPQAPAGVSVVDVPSGELRLKAWVSRPAAEDGKKRPGVVFLHGGFGFGKEDWEMAQPYRDAGFVVLAPILRGENGQAGTFSLFYNEVDDVLAAADYLGQQPYVDRNRLFVAGHSVGGILALLAAETSKRFRAAASFSGSPDQVLYCRYGFPKRLIPFDLSNPRELQVRSPLAYAASFKCPVRIYYGTREQHLAKTSRLMAAVAKEKGLDVEVVPVEGDHMSAVPAAMKQSIAFFRKNGG
jgi:dienelactone hydrolase